MYNKRSKMDPWWASIVVGGVTEGADGPTPFLGPLSALCECRNSKLRPAHLLLLRLGVVDKLGMSYEADFLTTGYGSHLALPILRNKWRAGLTAEEAKALLDECMRVLYVAARIHLALACPS